jgi:NAD(P)H dehydrogenase (quinone)
VSRSTPTSSTPPAALLGAGLPAPIAQLLADSDVGASKGGLFDDGHRLRQLIGRPTAALAGMVAVVLG